MILMSENGPVTEAFLDGYALEERLLEGVTCSES